MAGQATFDLLSELQELYDDHGRVPTEALMQGRGSRSPEEYVERFGSWDEALSSAGFDPDQLDEERYDTLEHAAEDVRRRIVSKLRSNEKDAFFRGQLLAELHRLATDLQKTPSGPEMDRFGRYTPSTYEKYFGSWNDAVKRVGLETNTSLHRVTDEDLLAELRRLGARTGSRPTTCDVKNRGRYSYTTYHNRFDDWETACERAGF